MVMVSALHPPSPSLTFWGPRGARCPVDTSPVKVSNFNLFKLFYFRNRNSDKCHCSLHIIEMKISYKKTLFILAVVSAFIMVEVHFYQRRIFNSNNPFGAASRIITVFKDDVTAPSFKRHQRPEDHSKILLPPNAQTQKFHFMIIVIPSMPQSKNYRDYLRRRWLNESSWGKHEFEGIDRQYLDFKLMFVIGRDRTGAYSAGFIEEVSVNDDIILIDKIEDKSILKDKVLWGMKKSIELFDYKYFIKIDHDTLVDLPHLAKGIQTLPDKNLYTGACKSTLKRRHAQYNNFTFCVGNAYILSRDVVEKISSLTEQEVDNDIIPEDGYTGWLVSEVKRKYNISELMPLVKPGIVDRFNYNVKRGMYFFDRWFYHWLKEIRPMERAFECRIRANFTLCPAAYYHYENESSTVCLCDTSVGRDTRPRPWINKFGSTKMKK